jgi:hypothetical protein
VRKDAGNRFMQDVGGFFIHNKLTLLVCRRVRDL